MVTDLKKKNLPVLILMASILISSVGFGTDQPGELTVFCASSLTGAFEEIGKIYENASGDHVVFNFDGTQMLRTQIENGAYADIFVSANTNHMNALEAEGYLNNSSVSIFTKNKLALIVPKANPGEIHNLADLARPGLKIVVGTKDVPVGNYTLQILEKLAKDPAFGPEYEQMVLSNVVSQETNVNYVVSKVALGEADAGFAYRSDVTAELADKVDRIEIPNEYNIIARYPIGITNQSKYTVQAKDFIKLVKSPQGNAVLKKFGFDPAS
jgi:molybdate transport system substrate-binding protein